MEVKLKDSMAESFALECKLRESMKDSSWRELFTHQTTNSDSHSKIDKSGKTAKSFEFITKQEVEEIYKRNFAEFEKKTNGQIKLQFFEYR